MDWQNTLLDIVDRALGEGEPEPKDEPSCAWCNCAIWDCTCFAKMNDDEDDYHGPLD